MKRKQFGVLLVCMLGAAAVADLRAHGAGGKRVKGSGIAKSDVRPVSEVREVSVHGMGTLLVEVGAAEELRIEADDNILPYIEVRRRGDAWEIGPVPDSELEVVTPIRYHLRVKRLEALRLSGAARAELKPLPAVAEFQLSQSGATSVQFGGITADSLKVDASGASRVEFRAGKVKRQTVRLSGACRYRAFPLASESASVHGSGTSSVEITTTRELSVEASGVTQVRYKGAPPVVRSDTSGVSSVKPA